MNKKAKFWFIAFIVIVVISMGAPFFSSCVGNPLKSIDMAFSKGGALGLGFDYLGRPIAPQLFEGGRLLILVAIVSAALTQALGLGIGLFLAVSNRAKTPIRFLLDAILLVPMIVSALAVYSAFSGSIWALVPVTALLNLPFSSRYYQMNAEGLIPSSFYEQARVAGDSKLKAAFRELVPVLLKTIMVDFGSAVIGSIYMLSTVTFLGTSSQKTLFLWPSMVSKNMGGLALNPMASLAPLLAIVVLSVPLNIAIDYAGRNK